LSGEVRWRVFADVADLLDAARDRVLTSARAALAARRRFVLVLAGGRTPVALYERLARANAGGPDWVVYFGDERCLPPDDPERNETMARAAWLDASRIPGSSIHAVPAALSAREAAPRYAMLLAQEGTFDLVLLGLGEDGHTASLFPGRRYGERGDAPAALAVTDSPKPPPERVTLSAPRLSDARAVLFLVSGSAKADAVARWRRGDDLPPQHIRPPDGVDVWLDAAAARPWLQLVPK
jgi:6-phosphogluconolactonase